MADEISQDELSVLPKKRGRPAKPNKVVKEPSGRGRGRPAKLGSGSGDEPSVNKNTIEKSYSGRGRPPKQGKQKLAQSIESTGRGRGRPRGAGKGDDDDDEEETRSPKPKALQGSPKKIGRPKKSSNSDDESSNDDDDRRPVGRPATGAVNLNIERTGKGVGRPKDTVNGDDSPSRKRGRPSVGKSTPYVPTGKARGRPANKRIQVAAEVDNDGTDEEAENGNDKSAIEVNETLPEESDESDN